MVTVFDPITLKHLTLKNRIVRSATHDYLGEPGGFITPKQKEMYCTLAKNEIGLIITGHMYVSEPLGKVRDGQHAIYDDKFIPLLQDLCEAVHQYDGCKIIAQISHGGALAGCSETPVAPSELKLSDRTARAVTTEEILKIREDFIDAAERAKKAGFDGVQVHIAHNYLLSEFVTPAWNRHREDGYGGEDAESRFTLPREIIAGIRRRCGCDFPVFVKINSNVFEGDDAYEKDLRYMLGGMKILGVEAVELSGCDFRTRPAADRLYYLERAAKLRRKIDLPMILVGGMRTLEEMNRPLAEGIDMIALSRPLICEPDFIPKLKAGQEKSICKGCNFCLVGAKKPGERCIYDREKHQ